jgi:serine/threonine protein kinase
MPASLDDIFIQAIELTDPRERESYLDSACANDESLRRQVEGLLAVAPRMANFLESPADTSFTWETRRSREVVVDISGQTLGPYRLIRLAGKGGMGAVYLAEQETPIRRQVAIKVIRSGLASASTLARFAHERHTLALMDHPNIARVLDAGTTPQGDPFIAMEWVEGIPITTFCDREQYSISQRVELLIAVCQAVQHAHQKGIIHRDLKPTNIMVTHRDGVAIPKVIDFGVARAVDPGLAGEAELTEAGQIVGTLEYMAPEQAWTSNSDVDTRADVFALGAILHGLLTGSPPVPADRFAKAGLAERLRVIREVEPARPSERIATAADAREIAQKRRTDAARLHRLVANELICSTLTGL